MLCADTEASGTFRRAAAPQHADAADHFSARDGKSRNSYGGAAQHAQRGRSTTVAMQEHMQASYGPMHLQAPVGADSVSRSVHQTRPAALKLSECSGSIQDNLRRSVGEAFDSIHDRAHERHAWETRVEAHEALGQRESAGHDSMHGDDDGSDSDDSYAWAQRKAEISRNGGWRGAH